MVIPSLDDEPTEEAITLKVAEAPERYTREMQSLHELDAGIKDQLGTRFAARSGEQVCSVVLFYPPPPPAPPPHQKYIDPVHRATEIISNFPPACALHIFLSYFFCTCRSLT